MQLRFVNHKGRQVDYDLPGNRPVIIGRAPEADVVLEDEKASRFHAEIRFWDGDYVVKDLRSRNGTLVNGTPISVTVLQPGDTIRIGAIHMVFDHRPQQKGANTMLREVSREFEEDKKGYRTVLREIISSTGNPNRPRKGK